MCKTRMEWNRKRLLFGFYALLAAAILWPVWSVKIPALVDYPNHLARLYVLAEIEHNPLLQRHYRAHWSINPYLLPDLIFSQLAKVLDIYPVGKIYISTVLVVQMAGILALRKALMGRVDAWACVAFVVLYNVTFQFGFLNFNLAVGFSLLALAGWMETESWRKGPRIVLFAAVGLVLFLTHGFVFALFGLMLAAYEWGRAWQEGGPFLSRLVPRWLPLGMIALPSGLAFLLWKVDEAPLPTDTKPAHIYLMYGSLLKQATAPISPLLILEGSPVSHYFSSLVLLVVLSILLVLSRSRRHFSLDHRLRWPLGALLILSVITPDYFLDVAYMHTRAPVFLWLIGLIAIVPKSSIPAFFYRSLVGFALGIVMLQLWSVHAKWAWLDGKYAEFLRASAAIARGSRILTVKDAHGEDRKPPEFYWNVPVLAVIERDAYVPTLFKMYSLRSASANAAIDTGHGDFVSRDDLLASRDDKISSEIDQKYRVNAMQRIYWAFWPKRYDFIYYAHEGAPENPCPMLIEPIEKGSFFQIFRIHDRSESAQKTTELMDR